MSFAAGYTNVTARLASYGGGSLEFRLDNTTGLRIGSLTMPNTGGWQTWSNVSGSVSGATGEHDVYLVFKGGTSIGNINWFQFGSPPPIVWPSPWVTADLGTVGQTGSASYGDGTFTLAGSGADIEGAADAFRFAYQMAGGACELRARVMSVQNSDPWAKAGVMIRESPVAGARNAALFITPGNGVEFQWRTSTGGTTSSTVVGSVSPPRWVRLVRSEGAAFRASHSADGINWTQIGTPHHHPDE